MSNSIWHKYDIKDIPNPHHEILAWTGTKHAVVIIKQAEWRSGDCDWIESWAYIQDILAQADKVERLQKAVDVAEEALKYARQRGLDNTATLFAVGTKADKALIEIKQLTQGDK